MKVPSLPTASSTVASPSILPPPEGSVPSVDLSGVSGRRGADAIYKHPGRYHLKVSHLDRSPSEDGLAMFRLYCTVERIIEVYEESLNAPLVVGEEVVILHMARRQKKYEDMFPEAIAETVAGLYQPELASGVEGWTLNAALASIEQEPCPIQGRVFDLSAASATSGNGAKYTKYIYHGVMA